MNNKTAKRLRKIARDKIAGTDTPWANYIKMPTGIVHLGDCGKRLYRELKKNHKAGFGV